MPILIPIAMAAVSAGSAIAASNKRKKAERRLEDFNNADKPNDSILDYYNKALSRYSPNPYTSSLYTAQKRNIERGTAQGLANAQNKRSGLAAVGALVQGQNDSLLNAAAQAESQQGQQLGQLGQAAGAKASEQRRVFENKYNLLAMKAGQAATRQNMATQSAINSLGNASSMAYMSGKEGNYGFGNLFGKGGGTGTTSSNSQIFDYLQRSGKYNSSNPYGETDRYSSY